MGQDARIKPAQLILLNGESQFGTIERENFTSHLGYRCSCAFGPPSEKHQKTHKS